MGGSTLDDTSEIWGGVSKVMGRLDTDNEEGIGLKELRHVFTWSLRSASLLAVAMTSWDASRTKRSCIYSDTNEFAVLLLTEAVASSCEYNTSVSFTARPASLSADSLTRMSGSLYSKHGNGAIVKSSKYVLFSEAESIISEHCFHGAPRDRQNLTAPEPVSAGIRAEPSRDRLAEP